MSKLYGTGIAAAFARHAAPGPDDARSGLHDISLQVPLGAALAILGRNGAGKSTLLRLLAGTARPTRGEVVVPDQVGFVADLGVGIQDEWTGEENARAYFRMTGLGGREARRAAEFVPEFSELGDFYRRPVRVYSSGMRLRLAYAMTVACQPRILIVDEVLAVGDEAFQRKCSRSLGDFVTGGGTLVLATHNLYVAQKLCGRAIWLERGRIRASGPCHEVATAYRESLDSVVPAADDALDESIDKSEGEFAVRRAVRGSPWAGGSDGAARLEFEQAWEVRIPAARTERRLLVEQGNGTLVASFALDRRSGRVRVPGRVLLPGRYRLRFEMLRLGTRSRPAETLWVECVGARREIGVANLASQWRRPQRPPQRELDA